MTKSGVWGEILPYALGAGVIFIVWKSDIFGKIGQGFQNLLSGFGQIGVGIGGGVASVGGGLGDFFTQTGSGVQQIGAGFGYAESGLNAVDLLNALLNRGVPSNYNANTNYPATNRGTPSANPITPPSFGGYPNPASSSSSSSSGSGGSYHTNAGNFVSTQDAIAHGATMSINPNYHAPATPISYIATGGLSPGGGVNSVINFIRSHL